MAAWYEYEITYLPFDQKWSAETRWSELNKGE